MRRVGGGRALANGFKPGPHCGGRGSASRSRGGRVADSQRAPPEGEPGCDTASSSQKGPNGGPVLLGQHRAEFGAAEAGGDLARLASMARDQGGRLQDSEDVLAGQLTTQEQAANDGGGWQAVWMLTRLEAPQSQMRRAAPKKGAVNPVPRLLDPEWRANAAALIAEHAALEESAAKQKGKGKGKGEKEE